MVCNLNSLQSDAISWKFTIFFFLKNKHFIKYIYSIKSIYTAKDLAYSINNYLHLSRSSCFRRLTLWNFHSLKYNFKKSSKRRHSSIFAVFSSSNLKISLQRSIESLCTCTCIRSPYMVARTILDGKNYWTSLQNCLVNVFSCTIQCIVWCC